MGFFRFTVRDITQPMVLEIRKPFTARNQKRIMACTREGCGEGAAQGTDPGYRDLRSGDQAKASCTSRSASVK